MITKSFTVRNTKRPDLGLGKVVGGTVLVSIGKDNEGNDKPIHVPQVLVLWENFRAPSPSFHMPEELEWQYIEGDIPTVVDVMNCLMKMRDSDDEIESIDDVIMSLGKEFDIDVDLEDNEEEVIETTEVESEIKN